MSTKKHELLQRHSSGIEGGEVVDLNVGGAKFSARRSTLTRVDDSFFSNLLSGRYPLQLDSKGRIFIDRPPKPFEVILDFLRTGKWYLPESPQLRKMVIDEADFYGIDIKTSAPDMIDDWCLSGVYKSPSLVLSDEGRVITKDDKTGNCFVVGTVKWATGKHCWEVHCLKLKQNWIMMGVISSPPTRNISYSESTNWAVSSKKQAYKAGSYSPLEMHLCEQGDVVHVQFDADAHVLEFFNVSKGSGCKIEGLPDASFYPHFNLYDAGDQIRVIPISQSRYKHL